MRLLVWGNKKTETLIESKCHLSKTELQSFLGEIHKQKSDTRNM